MTYLDANFGGRFIVRPMNQTFNAIAGQYENFTDVLVKGGLFDVRPPDDFFPVDYSAHQLKAIFRLQATNEGGDRITINEYTADMVSVGNAHRANEFFRLQGLEPVRETDTSRTFPTVQMVWQMILPATVPTEKIWVLPLDTLANAALDVNVGEEGGTADLTQERTVRARWRSTVLPGGIMTDTDGLNWRIVGAEQVGRRRFVDIQLNRESEVATGVI